MKHCTVKHFNNLIEQDHQHVKRRFANPLDFKIYVMPHVH